MVETVGVVGAGQLARMMCQAAGRLGVDVRVLARSSTDSACRLGVSTTVGDWSNFDALCDFATGCDVVTFDHELVPPDLVARVEAKGVVVRPGAEALAVTANKAHQRQLLESIGVPVPPFHIVTSVQELVEAGERFGYPLVAKAAQGGYDGRGVWFLADHRDAVHWFETTRPSTLVVEPALALTAELATIVVRGLDGSMVHYPLVRTYQYDGVCREVAAPATVDPDVAVRCREWAARIAMATGVVGELAVELFVVDGAVMVNELAPRPHNSGHYSIEACVTSQFENHLRAVTGRPLGSAAMKVPAAAMVNLFGRAPEPSAVRRLAPGPPAYVHDYGKDPRPGRKVGHLTLCGVDPVAVQQGARVIARDLSAATSLTIDGGHAAEGVLTDAVPADGQADPVLIEGVA